jgi:dihydrofolate reductase
MSRPRIEGYAIVSADGMIADSIGVMPPQLLIPADQHFFETGIDHAAAVVHGRNSQEHLARSAERRRLVVTRRVPGIAPDPQNPYALLWNPAGASFDEAWTALGVDDGTLAVLGGTDVFGLFLPLYDAFYLSRAARVRLPGGRPVFPGVPSLTPEQVLTRSGLRPGPERILDANTALSMVTWRRP